MAKIKVFELNNKSTGYESYIASEIWFENGDNYPLETMDAFDVDDIDGDIKRINTFIEKWKYIAEKDEMMFEIEKRVYKIIKELKNEKQ